MATATTWNSGGSTDANLAGNYSAGLPADAVITLDATSVVNWTLTANLSCDGVTIAAAYTGNATFAGFTLTCNTNAGFSWDGNILTGTTPLSTLTLNGASATAHFNGATINASLLNIVFNGTTACVLDDDKGSQFNVLTIGNSGKLTSSGTGTTTFSYVGTPLVIGTNVTFTINSTMNFYNTSAGDLYTLGAGSTIAGNGTCFFYFSNSGAAYTAPALTYTGTASKTGFLAAGGCTNATLTQTGAISINATTFRLYTGIAGSSFTYNTGGYAITAKAFQHGANIAGTTMTFNASSSLITCTSYDTYTAGTSNTNFQTSQWTCAGSWTFGTNHTVNPGAFMVAITANSTITSNSKTFFDFAIIGVGITVVLADNLTLATGGSFTLTNGTLNAGVNYIIFSGSGDITVAANVSSRLRTAVAGSTITWNTGANTWTVPAYAANDWGALAGADVAWRSSAPGVQYNISAPAAVVVYNMNPQDCNNSGAANIDATDVSNLDGGNNNGWDFPPVIGTPASQVSNRFGIGSMGF